MIPADLKRAKHIRYRTLDSADMVVMDEGQGNAFMPPDDCLPSESSTEEVEESEEDTLNKAESDTPLGNPNTHSAAEVLIDDDPSRSPAPVPRALVHRRVSSKDRNNDGEELMGTLKSHIVQDGLRREEGRKVREEERILQRDSQDQEQRGMNV